MVPEPVSGWFPYTVTPAFEAHAGTHTTLALGEGEDNTLWWKSGTSELTTGLGGTGDLFDPTTFVLTDRDGTRWHLSTEDGLLGWEDRHGNTVEVFDDGVVYTPAAEGEDIDHPDLDTDDTALPEPSPSGLFTASGCGPTGAMLGWVRDTEDRITKLCLPDGTERDYTYDGTTGDLLTVVATDGTTASSTTTFSYAADHLLEDWSTGDDSAQALAEATWDANGELVSRRDPNGVLVNESVDSAALTITKTTPAGVTSVEQYGTDGMLQSVAQSFTDAEGQPQVYTTTFEWTADNLLSRRETFYLGEDENQNPTTLPTGAVETWEYDDLERVTHHTDARGVAMSYTYGPYDQIAQELVGGEVVRSVAFDDDGRPRLVRDGTGEVRAVAVYDGAGRPTRLENGDGQVVSLTYDRSGQVGLAVLTPNAVDDADAVYLRHDGAGRTTSVKRNFGTVAAPDWGETLYAFDAEGRQTSITDPLGGTQTFTYDERNLVTSYTDKGGKTVEYAYDDEGRLQTQTNRDGQELTFTYDADHGVLSSVTADGHGSGETYTRGVSRSWTYDALGRMVSARDGDHLTTMTYDVDDLATVETDVAPDATNPLPFAKTKTEYVRDAAGRTIQMTGPTPWDDANTQWGTASQDTHTGYEEYFGLLAWVDDAYTGTAGSGDFDGTGFSFGYDTAQRLQSLTRPDGSTTTYAYDEANRLVSTRTHEGATGSSLLHALSWTHDGRGLPATLTDDEGAHDYDHDLRGRLTAVDHPTGSALSDESYVSDQQPTPCRPDPTALTA